MSLHRRCDSTMFFNLFQKCGCRLKSVTLHHSHKVSNRTRIVSYSALHILIGLPVAFGGKVHSSPSLGNCVFTVLLDRQNAAELCSFTIVKLHYNTPQLHRMPLHRLTSRQPPSHISMGRWLHQRLAWRR